MTSHKNNIDEDVVNDFGEEWKKFDQGTELSLEEKQHHFNDYFSIFPWNKLPDNAIGFDAGCGSGRWASLVAPKVGHLHCLDPSDAVYVAKKNLSELANCSFHKEAIHEMSLEDFTMDFGYSLGVLHHLPDPLEGLKDCVKKLKSGAPFLVYLYYAMDNQPIWYRFLWKITDFIRRLICLLPTKLKHLITGVIALIIYFPLARTSLIFERLGFRIHSWPLSNYRDKSFYTMKTDSLDRFGTRIEYRFTRSEVINIMELAGLKNIIISDKVPYYCALGFKH